MANLAPSCGMDQDQNWNCGCDSRHHERQTVGGCTRWSGSGLLKWVHGVLCCAVLCCAACDVLCVSPVGRYLLCNSVCGGRWTLRQPASATAHLGLALLALALAFALRAALDLRLQHSTSICSTPACCACVGCVRLNAARKRAHGREVASLRFASRVTGARVGREVGTSPRYKRSILSMLSGGTAGHSRAQQGTARLGMGWRWIVYTPQTKRGAKNGRIPFSCIA
jgi:hypothetical protein